MPTVSGREGVRAFFAGAPKEIDRRLRRGARAGGKVLADEARERVTSDEVRSDIVARSRAEAGRITVRVNVKPGWGRTLGTWLEYGTDPHFISVDSTSAGGRTAGRINRLDRKAMKDARDGPGRSLIINGKPVGATVYHPGARPYPWLRPAFDAKIDEALRAAQAALRGNAPAAPDGDDE